MNLPPTVNIDKPFFVKQIVQTSRPDGYWIETFSQQTRTNIPSDLIGLTSGDINLYHNPHNPLSTTDWKKTQIAHFTGPVGMDNIDLRGSGLNDVIICHSYGATMVACDPNGGIIEWLENPGVGATQEWERHYIGQVVSEHRLRIGHFTRLDKWQVVALPIVGRPFDIYSTATVILYTQPDDLLTATEWPSEVINNEYFHIIHDAVVHKYNNPTNPDGPLDSLLIAASEGIVWLHWKSKTKQWIIDHIGEGELGQTVQTGLKGSGGVDVGKLNEEQYQYIVTIEPFHGNTLALYVPTGKPEESLPPLLRRGTWRRIVLDVYGNVNINGEGPAHYIVTADFDEDGDDEFLVALRGPDPYQGVFYYKILNLEKGIVAKWRVSEESAARIAVADFDGDGHLDFATISYYVPRYYEDKYPSINTYYNRFIETKKQKWEQNPFDVRLSDMGQLQATVLKPYLIDKYYLSIVEIGGITVALEMIPPKSSRLVKHNVALKVLTGKIYWTELGLKKERSWCAQPSTVSPISFESDDGRIITGDNEGAVVFSYTLPSDLIPSYHDVNQITLRNAISSSHAPQEVLKYKFKWVQYGEIDPKFYGVDFYNLKGINIFEVGEDGVLLHLLNTQFWAAGVGVDCGLHNHSHDHFCEVHACIVNGTGLGGMTYAHTLDINASQISLPVPTLEEHGPLWWLKDDGTPMYNNGMIVYPYHRWQSGTGLLNLYDLWTAFEFNPDLAKVTIKKVISIKFNWPHDGFDVQVAGSFNKWKPQSINTKFNLIADTTYYYKFVVNGKWVYDDSKPHIDDGRTGRNNVIIIN